MLACLLAAWLFLDPCAGLPDGHACDDLDLCTTPDVCLEGRCRSAGSGTFTPAAGSPAPAGTTPWNLTVGDFDRDRRPDVAVANAGSHDLTILLGDGLGGLAPAPGSPVAVGREPFALAAGDLDADGNPDLAVVNHSSNDLTILLGRGDGSFTPARGSPVAVGIDAYFVALGRIDADARPDLVVVNHTSHDATILLGDGKGGFAQAVGSPIGLGFAPTSVAIGDVDRDGDADLALTIANVGIGQGRIVVLLGDGTGRFAQAAGSPISTGPHPAGIAIADLDGNGNPDLAVAGYGSRSVTVLLGDGHGRFATAPGSPLALPAGPFSIAVADFDLDGRPDVALSPPNVTILLGDGTGRLTPAPGSPVPGEESAWKVAVGDLNGDRELDLAVANAAGSVSIFLGNPSVLDCDDADPCTSDACDAAHGCRHAPLDAGKACSDGDACSAGETCDHTGACTGGMAVGCDDGDPCSSDRCDPALGCLHELGCDDGDPCSADTCEPGVGCAHEPLTPGEIGRLAFPIPALLLWPPEPRAASYDVARGSLDDLGASAGTTCFRVLDSSLIDSSVPAGGYFYVVRGRAEEEACTGPWGGGRSAPACP